MSEQVESLDAGLIAGIRKNAGLTVAAGITGLMNPTRVVEDAIETFTVDGIEMVFQNTPDTEAPSEMNTYIPSMKTLWMAENVVASVHNIYTLTWAIGTRIQLPRSHCRRATRRRSMSK